MSTALPRGNAQHIAGESAHGHGVAGHEMMADVPILKRN